MKIFQETHLFYPSASLSLPPFSGEEKTIEEVQGEKRDAAIISHGGWFFVLVIVS